MTPERIAELRIEALSAKYAGKEFTIPASETMEILNIAMNQFVPRVTPEMWKELGKMGASIMVSDLAMLVRRLARSLEKANPGTDVARQALDYLERKGLQGSPLRSDKPEEK